MEAAYHIEVRKDGFVFFEKDQMENEIALDLVPGYYEYQIQVLDPFGKVLSNSGWIPLNVTRSQIPAYRLITPVTIASRVKNSFSIPIDSSDLNPGTEFYLQGKKKRIKGEWNGLQSPQGEVIFSDVRLKSGSWELTAVDPSKETFSQTDAVIARPMYRTESSLRESQFDIQIGTAPLAAFSQGGSGDTALSLWSIDAVLLVQSGSTVPLLRDMGLEFHGRLGYAGADPVTQNPGLLGRGDLSIFYRPNSGNRVLPYIQAGTGFLATGSDDFFSGKTALVFSGGAGIDINKNRHYFRLGLSGSYGYTDSQEMIICELIFRWGYQL